MRTEEATMMSSERAPSLPPALYLIRARPRTSKVLGLDSPSAPCTPPLRSRVTVPFLWEEAPGKPKLRETAASGLLFSSAATVSPFLVDGGATGSAGGEHEDGARTRPVPLKLPPRLQTAEHSLSPKTVLQGPYFGGGGGGGGKKPPRPLRRRGSTANSRMKLGAGGALFSWRKATAGTGIKKDGHDHDASCCSPAASSASSSSSSSSMSYFYDDHSRGAHWQQADGREDSEDGEVGVNGVKGSVRITRFRRNRSLPSMTTSHVWGSIRKSVKQISPWS